MKNKKRMGKVYIIVYLFIMLSLSTSIVYSSSYSSQEINIGETTNPLPQINTSFNEIVKIDDAYFYPTSLGGIINAFYTNISNRVGDYAQNWSFQPQIPLINSSLFGP